MSVKKPKVGTLTFDSEGTEQGRYHSRKLHVPSQYSGLTIGRGYDLKTKKAIKVQKDLVKAGLKVSEAFLLSKAAGLYGSQAKNFISRNSLAHFEISQDQQVKLFLISYLEEEAEAKRLCSKPDVTKKYGNCNWEQLDPRIKAVVIDLKFRGDYTGKTRKFLQKHIVQNDFSGFRKAIANETNWAEQRVPIDRFQRRISYLDHH